MKKSNQNYSHMSFNLLIEEYSRLDENLISMREALDVSSDFILEPQRAITDLAGIISRNMVDIHGINAEGMFQEGYYHLGIGHEDHLIEEMLIKMIPSHIWGGCGPVPAIVFGRTDAYLKMKAGIGGSNQWKEYMDKYSKPFSTVAWRVSPSTGKKYLTNYNHHAPLCDFSIFGADKSRQYRSAIDKIINRDGVLHSKFEAFESLEREWKCD